MSHDKALIERLLRGDRSAFETIVLEHQATIFGYLRARLMQPSDAEDLTQEVFLRFYTSRLRFDPSNLIRPWLLGIARNLLKEHARKTKRRKEIAWTRLCLELEELLDAEDQTYEDVVGHLPGCMEGLGESAREAIELRYTCNMPLLEIGHRLHRSEGAVKLLMFRARQALKYCLQSKISNVTS